MSVNPPATESSAPKSCPMGRLDASHPSAGATCPVSDAAAAFDPFDAAYMASPAEYLRWACEQAPVFWSPTLGYWVVTRYEDVKAVFRDPVLFSPANALEKITPATPDVTAILQRYGYAMNRTMVNEDEPDHMARRRLLMDAFLPERLMRYEPTVRTLTRRAMDRFVDRGRADLVAELFYEVPLSIALAFLGVPDDGAEELRRFAVAHTLNTWGRPTPEQQREIAESVGRFWQTAQRILDRMLAQPDGDGWMYESIRQHLRHPDIVPESYLRSMMMAILAAAHETTSNASANAFMTLLGQRDAWEAICANPALIPNAVEECLRVAGSIIAWRRVATDEATVGGMTIPRGGKLLLVMASANADPRHFENPEQVDLYRDAASEHLSFGYGAHQCMGKNLARMQMRVFLEEFVQRLPHLRLVDRQRFEFLPNTSFRGPSSLQVEWDPARNPERRDGTVPARTTSFYIGAPSKSQIVRPVIVRERHPCGEGLVRLVLEAAPGTTLPAWTAGSHVDLISGGFRRKYSLCGRPEDREVFEVVIQREAAGRGGSRHFCATLTPGSPLAVSGPRNLFRLDESAERYVLVAAGIGITPIIAMADRLASLGKRYEIHYAGRSVARMALLDRLARDHAGALTTYLGSEGRRLSLPAVLGEVDAGTRVYACGPERLLDELATLGRAWPASVLRVEHFGHGGPALDPGREHAFEAVLRDSGRSVTVPADQTLLHALQAAGVDVPNDCGEGLCGSCEVQVLDGDVDHRDKVLDRAERAAGRRMMACCSRAAGERITLAL